jgi:hypothetical protein
LQPSPHEIFVGNYRYPYTGHLSFLTKYRILFTILFILGGLFIIFVITRFWGKVIIPLLKKEKKSVSTFMMKHKFASFGYIVAFLFGLVIFIGGVLLLF